MQYHHAGLRRGAGRRRRAKCGRVRSPPGPVGCNDPCPLRFGQEVQALPRLCAAPVRRQHLAGAGDPRPAHQHWRRQRRHRRASPACQRQRSLRRAGARTGLEAGQVPPFSTGVILSTCRSTAWSPGCPERSEPACRRLVRRRAHAIMTTDTVAKASPGPYRRAHGHPHRHQQGRRHDQAQHGHHARFRLPATRRSRRTCSMAWCARPPTCPSTASPSMATPRPTTLHPHRHRRPGNLPRPPPAGPTTRPRAAVIEVAVWPPGDRARRRGRTKFMTTPSRAAATARVPPGRLRNIRRPGEDRLFPPTPISAASCRHRLCRHRRPDVAKLARVLGNPEGRYNADMAVAPSYVEEAGPHHEARRATGIASALAARAATVDLRLLLRLREDQRRLAAEAVRCDTAPAAPRRRGPVTRCSRRSRGRADMVHPWWRMSLVGAPRMGRIQPGWCATVAMES